MTTGTSKYAYAFVLGRCGGDPTADNPDDPCTNYLYNIAVATKILRDHSSQADVIVFVQKAVTQPRGTTLSAQQQRLLEAMKIQVRYIPQRQKQENFYTITLNKFMVLQLTEYQRVLFMDADVIPRDVSLDYLFDMSVQGVLKENVVLAGNNEPSSAGFFLLTPRPGDWDHIQDIIEETELRSKQLPAPHHWDEVVGWGHAIEQPDHWELINGKTGTNWTFYCAYSDQGLLYHWVKYVKQSVSILIDRKVEHWGSRTTTMKNGTTTTVALHEETLSSADVFKGEALRRRQPLIAFNDVFHFTGDGKPWICGPPKDFLVSNNETANANASTSSSSGVYVWFSVLAALNDEYDMGLDFAKWKNTTGLKHPSIKYRFQSL